MELVIQWVETIIIVKIRVWLPPKVVKINFEYFFKSFFKAFRLIKTKYLVVNFLGKILISLT